MPRTKTTAKKTAAKKTTANTTAALCDWCGRPAILEADLITPHKMKPTDTSNCPGTGHPPLAT